MGVFLMMLGIVGVSAAPAATSNLEFNPPTYSFGQVPYEDGPTEPHGFTLTNTADIQLTIKRWRSRWLAYWPEAPDPFWVTSSNCHILEPGESCSIGVVFDPIHPGPGKGWQLVKSQIEEEPWGEVEFKGEGVGPWIPLTPSRVVFESVAVGMTTSPRTITLEGQGRDGFTIAEISTAPVGSWPMESTPFQIVGGSCHEGEMLGPGKTCTIEVVMAPTEAGVFKAELKITDNAPDSPQSIELEGTAMAVPADGQQISPSPSALTSPVLWKRACPKGKRKVFRKGRWICVKRRNHRRHPARTAR